MDIHSLPFSIGFNGEAEVESAFPVIIDNQKNEAESAFRGRKLSGRIHEIPSNLTGNMHFSLNVVVLIFVSNSRES